MGIRGCYTRDTHTDLWNQMYLPNSRDVQHTSSSTWCASPESISIEWSGAQWALWAVGGHSANEESRKQHTRQSSSWTLFNIDLFKQTSASLLTVHGSYLCGLQPQEKSYLSSVKLCPQASCWDWFDSQHSGLRWYSACISWVFICLYARPESVRNTLDFATIFL